MLSPHDGGHRLSQGVRRHAAATRMARTGGAMSRRHFTFRLVLTALLLLLAFCLPALLPAGAAANGTLPEKAFISGVPFYQQIQAHGCGAAATQMVLDYCGPFVNQKAVYDAARTWHGSSLPDLARAGQFSAESYSAGDRFPAAEGWGYPGRPLGEAGFYYAATAPWLEQLKAIIAQGYPVICLTDWLPGVSGPHYRVVVGYDDTKGVLYINDPWAREFKQDSDYQGSADQNSSGDRQGTWAGVPWTYADFEAVWGLSSSSWGVPDLNYGAVFIAPWRVSIDAPASVTEDSSFTVQVTVTYPCPAPFAGSAFPQFPAAGATVQLSLPPGFRAAGGDVVNLGTLSAGQSETKTVTVTAGDTSRAVAIGATASGTISGSLGAWRTYPAYDYHDVIGGSGSVSVSVTAD